MYIIPRKSNPDGSFPPLNQWNPKYKVPVTHYVFPDKFWDVFYMEGKRLKGYVNLIVSEDNPDEIVDVTWNEEAYQAAVALLPDPIIEVREAKLSQLATACNSMIDAGTEVTMPDGTRESFTYSLADQANVSEMFTAVMAGATGYAYHENDGNCKMYTAQDIIVIYSTLSGYKTAQLTYHNQLKQYVKSLDDEDTIRAVTYGQELTGEYLATYNQLLAEAKAQMEAVLAKFVSPSEPSESGDSETVTPEPTETE